MLAAAERGTHRSDSEWREVDESDKKSTPERVREFYLKINNIKALRKFTLLFRMRSVKCRREIWRASEGDGEEAKVAISVLSRS
jgi:hypothetical protein